MQRNAGDAALPGAESPRRRGFITGVGEKYPIARKVQRLVGYEPGGSRRAAFHALAKMGVRAVPALLAEMEDKMAENRVLAAILLRKVVEGHPHADWDRMFPVQKGGWVKETLAALSEDENEEVALNAAGALGMIMKRMPCDGIGAFGESRISMMGCEEVGGKFAGCGAALKGITWLLDGEEL